MSKDELTLVVGGDTGVIRKFGQKVNKDLKYASFLKVLEEADIVFTNLECTLTNYEFPSVFHCLMADPTLAEDLALIGVDIVSLAHHAFDLGVVGFIDTIDALDKENIKHVGAGRSFNEAMKEEIIEVKEQKIGFLAFSVVFPKGLEAGVAHNAENISMDKPGVSPIFLRTTYEINPRFSFGVTPSILQGIISKTSLEEENLKNVLEKIKEAKKSVDFLIVAIHWGAREKIFEYQPNLAHVIIEAGADIILGHHPHRPHGVEVYKGRPIFYSLGNFIYQRTGMADYLKPEQTFGRLKIVGGDITKIEIIPTLLDNVCTSIADLNSRDKMFEYLKRFEKKYKFGTKYSIHGKEIPIEVSF